MTEAQLRELLKSHGFTVANMSYRKIDARDAFEYRMIIRTADEHNTARLADALRIHEAVREFRISPTAD